MAGFQVTTEGQQSPMRQLSFTLPDRYIDFAAEFFSLISFRIRARSVPTKSAFVMQLATFSFIDLL
jgi:hypothetical protein